MHTNRYAISAIAIGLLGAGTVVFGQTPAPVDFEKDIQPIFTASCAVAGCHVPGGSGPMSLETGVAYANLLNPPPPISPRVIPGDTVKSLLVQRIEGTSPPQMPLGKSPLPQAQIDLIKRWISEGALKTPGAVLASDFDGDGDVDFDDFFAFADVFGTQQGDARFNAKFDLNGNGKVDLDDFFIFAEDFGKKTK